VTVPAEVLWNIYYDRYLNEKDMQVMQAQVRKLLEIPPSLPAWIFSEFGAFLGSCDQATLDSVRAVWRQYDEAVSSKDTKGYRDNFESAMKKSREHKATPTGRVLPISRLLDPPALRISIVHVPPW
jgi:hypothetical protein